MAATSTGKWLSDADQIVTRYRAGGMRYDISDALLKPGGLVVDVIPRAESEGAVVRVAAADGVPAMQLVWAFGGASGLTFVESGLMRVYSRSGLSAETRRLCRK